MLLWGKEAKSLEGVRNWNYGHPADPRQRDSWRSLEQIVEVLYVSFEAKPFGVWQWVLGYDRLPVRNFQMLAVSVESRNQAPRVAGSTGSVSASLSPPGRLRF